MKFFYILQEKVSDYDYRDVIEVATLGLCRKYLQVLKSKYPSCYYRIIKGGY